MVTLKKYYYVVKIKNIERDWKMENIFDNLKELIRCIEIVCRRKYKV